MKYIKNMTMLKEMKIIYLSPEYFVKNWYVFKHTISFYMFNRNKL